ncbi:hypothetical protein KIW84_015884 [Lathyrus oleraceus]|uniref:Lactoylglutathione lyase n=1 Tax=Pisum sativum TaxID=3888 RepID=A0A9D5BRH2_PEA|nr:hypothetical protein KIW84_015884 [Pisum sativum]
MKIIMKKLDAMKIEYVRAAVEDGGIEVDQLLFHDPDSGIEVDQLLFHDPDSYMIEICNCQNLPVLPISTCPLNQHTHRKNQAQPFYIDFVCGWNSGFYFLVFAFVLGVGEGKNCSAEDALLMMEKLTIDLLRISI